MKRVVYNKCCKNRKKIPYPDKIRETTHKKGGTRDHEKSTKHS